VLAKLSIESMNINHIDDILKIENECFVSPWPRVFFEQELDNGLSYGYVCLYETKVIAFICYRILFEMVEITNLAVVSALQNHKIGNYILSYCLQSLPDDIENIVLEVRVSNMPAIKLYEGCGFKIINKRLNYYENGEDAFIMEKII
jgi:ribosomal-protein-alanine N-acetyltransferase